MTIYDREKMKQLPVYPTKQTPSYADWRLFEMGADLEEKVDNIPGGVVYSPGSGIAISEENVISNTAQPDVTKAYVDGVDVNLQQQIDAIVASSDVKDIVGTYAELQAYDTTTLGNNDIVKVLVDSTHNDATGYYRWVITQGVGAWSYIGSEGPYYTKSQTDTELAKKLDKDFSNANVGQATAGQVLAVNSSANGVEFVTPQSGLPAISSGDAGKVLSVNSGETGAEWKTIFAGFELDDNIRFSLNSSLAAGEFRTANISGLDSNYDYILLPYTINTGCHVNPNSVSGLNYIPIRVRNLTDTSISSGTILVTYKVYKRPKEKSNNSIIALSTNSDNCLYIPSGGTANQVFKKTGSGYAQGNWQDIKEVPSSSASDVGKVLGVTAANTYGWISAGGGGGITPTRINAISDINVGDFCAITINDASFTYSIVGVCISKDTTFDEYEFCGTCIDTAYNAGTGEIVINNIYATKTITHVDSIDGYKL